MKNGNLQYYLHKNSYCLPSKFNIVWKFARLCWPLSDICVFGVVHNISYFLIVLLLNRLQVTIECYELKKNAWIKFAIVALHLFCIEIFQSSQHICRCWRFVVLCNLPPLSISSHLGWWNKRLNKNGLCKFNYVYAIIIIGLFWIYIEPLRHNHWFETISELTKQRSIWIWM